MPGTADTGQEHAKAVHNVHYVHLYAKCVTLRLFLLCCESK